MSFEWRTKKWYIGPLNFCDEVTKQYHFADKVIFHDVSLRDGEQQAGIVFNYDRKLALAERLAALGVDRIEVGMPAVSEEDERVTREIVKRNLGPDIYCFSRCVKSDVDLAYDCGVRHLVMEIPSNPVMIEQAYGWTMERAINSAAEATAYAHSKGIYVNFFAMDSTRADPHWVLDMMDTILANGGHMDEVTVVDTNSVLNPISAAYITKLFKEHFPDKKVGIHVHDEFDLSTATSLAALAAGANVVHTSVSNIGERAGNAGYEAIAMALKLLYGQPVSLNLDQIVPLSEYMQSLTGYPVRINAPVVGPNLSLIESGMPVSLNERIKDTQPEIIAPYDYTMTGHAPLSYAIGKKSGKDTVRVFLNKLGLTVEPEKVDEILADVKLTGIAKLRALTEDEFRQIALKHGAK